MHWTFTLMHLTFILMTIPLYFIDKFQVSCSVYNLSMINSFSFVTALTFNIDDDH